MLKKPELLAPAGTLEKMKMALLYGADAVYLGGKLYGLRALGGNFTKEELREAVEEARHWLAAGPTHAGTAWRAAVAAAEVARDLHAHEETAALLGSALAAMGDDPSSTAHDRYDVLMARADAYRWSGRWVELTADIRSAIDAARTVGEVRPHTGGGVFDGRKGDAVLDGAGADQVAGAVPPKKGAA